MPLTNSHGAMIFVITFVLQLAVPLLSKIDKKMMDDSLKLKSDGTQCFLIHNKVNPSVTLLILFNMQQVLKK